MNKEKLPLVNKEILLGADFPLIDTWMESVGPAMQKTQEIIDGTSEIPVPEFLLPTQQMWIKRGPVILSSYSHPENATFYKYAGSLNLALVLAALTKQGINIPRSKVLESWYDTIDIDSSAKKPLSFGESFTADADLLGIGNSDSSLSELKLPGKEFDLENTINIILGKLTNELYIALQNSGYDKADRTLAMGSLRALLSKRINEVTRITRASISEISSDSTPRTGQLLFEFGQRLGGTIFGDEDGDKLSDVSGIKGTLASDNTEFNNLVFDTLDYLVSNKGADIMRNLAQPNEELFLGYFMGIRASIAVNPETGVFTVYDRKSRNIISEISDESIIDFVRKYNFIPFGKTETLALLAGGVSFHMGSERGERERAIDALGISSEYQEYIDYLNSLRIGQDGEQGNYVIAVETIPGKYKPMPAVLAYVLFGKEFLLSQLINVVGKTKKPLVLTKDELKKLTASQLAKEVKKD